MLENDSYLHSTQDEPAFKAVGFGTVIDREETVVEISTVTLKKPELSVKVHAKDKGSELYVAEVSLVNPILDRPLNNCRIISVLSVIKMKGKVESFSIQPAKKFTINFDFEFVSSKDKKAILQLDCENLHDVIGEAQFSDVIKKVENTEEIELARAISSKPKINSTNKAANQTETTKAARKVKNKNAKNSSPKPKMKV